MFVSRSSQVELVPFVCLHTLLNVAKYLDSNVDNCFDCGWYPYTVYSIHIWFLFDIVEIFVMILVTTKIVLG